MRRLAAPFLMTASMAAPAGAQPAPEVKPPKRPTEVAVDGGVIRKDARSGMCRQYFTSKCPPGARCNPPPPRPVRCPPELLPDAGPDETVLRRPDGTCEAMVHVKCPPGVLCNPPPPRPVRCPAPDPASQPAKPPASQPASGFAPPPPGR